MKFKALLVINLGTPKSPEPKDVGVYLEEFLMDKFVISVPFIIRWILVKLIIVPRRKFFASKNYKKIWDNEKGSPLFFHSKSLVQKIKNHSDYQEVKLAMRYGQPDIQNTLKQLSEYDQIDVLPLYPHSTGSSTGTAIEKTKDIAKKIGLTKRLNILPIFFNQDFYLQEMKEQIMKSNADLDSHFVFSYHGIPVNHLQKSCQKDSSINCLEKPDQELCYRSQCYKTSLLLANMLGLTKEQYTTTFQSRLGRTPWIQPYLDDTLGDLAKKQIDHITLISPSFIVDCLETLEELALEVPKDYQELRPAARIDYIPCLNDSDTFAKNLGIWAYNQN
jgi:ferrochelatase